MKAARAWLLAAMAVIAAGGAQAAEPAAAPSACSRTEDVPACRWMAFGAVAPEAYLAQHIDMVRIIGTQDYGNLHLFAEFTHLPDGAAFLQTRDVSGMARAATISISEADWRDVVSHTERFLADEAKYRRDTETEERKPDSGKKEPGAETAVVCGDGLSISLEVVAHGAVSATPILGCGTLGDEFAAYMRSKTLALTPGCALLTQEASEYCLILAGDVFSAASAANAGAELFRMSCDRHDGSPSAPEAAFTIDGKESDEALRTRWRSLRCSSPSWSAFPSEILAHDGVAEITGTIEYDEETWSCPKAVEREVWRRFLQKWKRDGAGAFRIVQWDIGPASTASTETHDCR